MDTSVNKEINLAKLALGEEHLSRKLTAEESVELLFGLVKRLKPKFKEYRFTDGTEYGHLMRSTLASSLRKVRTLDVYGGQQHHLDGNHGYAIYCITPAGKWFRVFTSYLSGDGEHYASHEWLTRDDLIAVFLEDPKLIWWLVDGLKNRTNRSAAFLRDRAKKLDDISDSICEVQTILKAVGMLDH